MSTRDRRHTNSRSSTNCTLSQSPHRACSFLQGLVPTSALANTAAGKAALAANFAVTAAVQDGSAKQPLLLPFPEQQQQALRDAYITDGNAYELADGLGTALSHAYWSVCPPLESRRWQDFQLYELSPAIALLIAYTNSTTRSDLRSWRSISSATKRQMARRRSPPRQLPS